MNTIPASVIWFAVNAFIAIGYGLHVAHIRTVGFEAYVQELIKKHGFTYSTAKRHAIFNFWFGWALVVGCGTAATAFLAISIINLVNPHKIW